MRAYEVEVKYRVGSIDEVKKSLEAMGAKMLDAGNEVDIYFNHPCRNFAETDEAVRIRLRSDGTIVLTYKGPKIGDRGKTREEIDVVIGDLNSAIEFLRKNGYKEVARISKYRELYNLGDYTIYVDRVHELGDFVEIETVVNDVGLINSAVQRVLDLGDRLGLSRDAIEKRTYLELVLSRR